jgi:hypothetical protein
VPHPGTGGVPEAVLPDGSSDTESNSLAFRAFLYDFCIIPTDTYMSRGYLSGLEVMARRSGPDSNLVKVCQAVSFAIHGKPLHRPEMVHKAATLYQELLGSLAKTIQDPDVANTTESKLVVMLLGLYQVAALTLPLLSDR